MIPNDDLLSTVLSEIAKSYLPKDYSGGYGVDINNDIFMMHPYCWCDNESCPWCREEDPAPNFYYKPLGIKVWWYKYVGRGMKCNRDVSVLECAEILQACLKR